MNCVSTQRTSEVLMNRREKTLRSATLPPLKMARFPLADGNTAVKSFLGR